MARPPKPPAGARPVDALVHGDTRRNIPTAEFQSLAQQMEEQAPVRPARYARATPLPPGETRPRNADRDPQLIWRGMHIRLTPAQVAHLAEHGEIELADAQLVWRGKDAQDWSDLVVNPPPIYIQEKVHPKAIIDALQRDARRRSEAAERAPDLFADFNGLDDPEARLEFYQHEQHWSNRMILGDSLQVMASLAEREGLRGKVQCIYFDPPYGIKFNSNWQVSTQSRDVKDGKREDVSREPEQVKAFRDTWKDGVHSYLTYLRDRLTVARELLSESGSIFVQIGDENVHRVRSALDEVFGSANFLSQVTIAKTGGQPSERIPNVTDYVLWFAKDCNLTKLRSIYLDKIAGVGSGSGGRYTQVDDAGRNYRLVTLTSAKPPGSFPVEFQGETYVPVGRYWTTGKVGMSRVIRGGRVIPGAKTINFQKYLDDFPAYTITNVWTDTAGSPDKTYVVQTSPLICQRCLLLATDPGDLVLDPTCGSGTAATVAEQWGRRWITIDTSRVALALARTRLMSAKYPYYLLADSPEGRTKEQSVSGKHQPDTRTGNDVRHGFVYERAPHVTLKSIANNAEIDVIWERWQETLEPLRVALNTELGRSLQEWEIPREAADPWPVDAAKTHTALQAARANPPQAERLLATLNRQLNRAYTLQTLPATPADPWKPEPEGLHAAWWKARIARQKEIDASIARKADIEFLYDRPYEDKSRIRVAGPFTVESLSPHRVVPADEQDLLDTPGGTAKPPAPDDFTAMVLDHLRTAGVHQTQKADSIRFTSLAPWPGEYIGAEGRFLEGAQERRAAILIGPEFGTVSRIDLVTAAREAADARFDLVIACAFNFDAHAAELTKLGPVPILKARMNPDLHMAEELKNTGRGNLFVVFGEPDVVIEPVPGQPDHVQIRIRGVDVFDPQSGDIRSGDTDSIAAWFIDTDYNEESFFVRHAYFLGAQDPYKSLKAALRAEIDEAAWASLYREVSRPFARPAGGRIAVKVINHFGDEVMKVFTI
jgi:adenine-specific DNA-methyltransferase